MREIRNPKSWALFIVNLDITKFLQYILDSQPIELFNLNFNILNSIFISMNILE